MAILPLLNLSLNETLARTVVTSLTVLIALGVLMLIGPEVIFGLADRDLPRRADRHLFVDLHLGAGAGLARRSSRDSFLKTDEKEEARGAAGLNCRSAKAKLSPVHAAAWPPPEPTLMRFPC